MNGVNRVRHRNAAAVVGVMFLMLSFAAPMRQAFATDGPRVDMRFLVIAADGHEPTFGAWKYALDTEGIPYDALVATTADPLTPSFFGDATHARYQAVILTSDNLLYRDPSLGYISALASSEWTALGDFERAFGIQQLCANVWPKASVGLNPPRVAGNLDGCDGNDELYSVPAGGGIAVRRTTSTGSDGQGAWS